MRHQAKNVPALVADAGDVLKRTVRISFFGNLALAVRIAHQHLIIFIKLKQGRAVREVIAFAVGDGNF